MCPRAAPLGELSERCGTFRDEFFSRLRCGFAEISVYRSFAGLGDDCCLHMFSFYVRS
jgi:hypothetical protein